MPGDAHSRCNHPDLEGAKDPLLEMMAIFASVGRVPPMEAGVDKLGIKANPYGIKMGWFNFPWNFDPVWLEVCNGFKNKINTQKEVVK